MTAGDVMIIGMVATWLIIRWQFVRLGEQVAAKAAMEGEG